MENTSVNINTGHNYKRKIPVLTGRTKFCILPTVGREPVGPQEPWPTGREPRVYSREGGTLGLVGGETGYGELRRPWARVPLTGLP